MTRLVRNRTLAAVALIAIVFGVGVLVWTLQGLSMFVIVTPSMSTAAPVGSLVVVQPQADYRVGQIVSYRTSGRTITHRIVGTTRAGFITRGDLNGSADAGVVPRSAIVGSATWIVPGLGWLIKAVPWLAIGMLLTEAAVRVGRWRAEWRWAIRLTLWSLAVCLLSLWLRPWFNAELLDYRPAVGRTGMLMHLVNTGLLPLSAEGTRFVSGQDVVVAATHRTVKGAYLITASPSLTPSEIVAVVAVCAIPFLLGVIIGRLVANGAVAENLSSRSPRAEVPVIAGIAVSTVAVVVATLVFSTGATFTAAILNSSNTAATNSAFTCRAAETTVGPTVAGVYGLFTSGATTEPDLSGNSRTSTWATSTTTSSAHGCVRDTPAASVTFDGSSQCMVVPGPVNNINTFTLEAWFQTSTAPNGRIIGFGDTTNGPSEGNSDRLVYLGPGGRLLFGVRPGSTNQVIGSPAGTNYADGQWHQVVAVLSSAGMALYVDGALVSTNTSVTTGQNYSGYWKVGCGKLAGWSSAPGTGDASFTGPSYFTGSIQYVALWAYAVSASQVRAHYLAGTSH